MLNLVDDVAHALPLVGSILLSCPHRHRHRRRRGCLGLFCFPCTRCRFIFALGVQLVGARMAEVIAKEFGGDFEAFWGALIR